MAKKVQRPVQQRGSRKSIRAPAQTVAKKVQRPVQQRGSRKHLIRWSLELGREELMKIARQPQVLERALNFVKGSIKEGEAKIYRIVPIEELSSSPRMTENGSTSTKGIAIVEASSVEAVRRMVENILEGLTFGGFPVARNYIEFDISPLIEITEEGGKT